MADPENMLRRLLKEINIGLDGDVEVKALTSGGANYTSALFSLYIPSKELRLFAKVANVGEKLRVIMNVEQLFSTEQYVYMKIVEIFEELQRRYDVPAELRFVFPEFFTCSSKSGEETVVLEDLSVRGFSSYNRFEPVDWEHASSAVGTLAKFHALSFAFQAEFPEEYQMAIEKTIHKARVVDDDAKQSYLNVINRSIAVLTNESHKEKLAIFFNPETLFEGMIKFKMPSRVVVLAHGDYRPSNLLFRKMNDILETIVVDYQTVHAGCPVADLLCFIFTGSDENFRAKHHQQLLEHYYSELTSALDRVKIDINEVYPREAFDSELREKLPHALRLSAVVLPLVMVDETNAPRVCGDADLTTFAIEPNALFARRFNGIVSDCATWGII